MNTSPLHLAHLSGGMDSTASALMALDKGPTKTIFFSYGQFYGTKERKGVTSVLKRIDNHPNFKGHLDCHLGLLLTQPGQNADYIPLRNLVLATVSMNYALSLGAEEIVVGNKTVEIRPDDPWSFKDCTSEFYHDIDCLARKYAETKETPEFWMPLRGWTKMQVLSYIARQYLWLISELWSCYQHGEIHCGECYHCRELFAALKEARIPEGAWPEVQTIKIEETKDEQTEESTPEKD